MNSHYASSHSNNESQQESAAEPDPTEHDPSWNIWDTHFDAHRDPSRHLDGRSAAAFRSTIVGPLDQGSCFYSSMLYMTNPHADYQVIMNPRGFFKKGRVFMVPLPEPGGDSLRDQMGPPVFVKIRRFVVVRPRTTFCLCLPIQTYQGQATTKPGVSVHEHAAVVQEGHTATLHPDGETLTKPPISIKLENPKIHEVDPMSRVNFGKVYTVEYNVKVCNIGRLVPESIYRMDRYFSECFRLEVSNES